MTDRQKQSKFASMVPALINKAIELGFEVTLGDAYRHPSCPYGSEVSLHHIRLAIDLNLFKNGEYMKDSKSHRQLGEWWESQGGSWGGRYNDGNHYSLEHNGRK